MLACERARYASQMARFVKQQQMMMKRNDRGIKYLKDKIADIKKQHEKIIASCSDRYRVMQGKVGSVETWVTDLQKDKLHLMQDNEYLQTLLEDNAPL